MLTGVWKALKERKKEGVAETPNTSKTLAIIKWSEAFADFLRSAIGARTSLLSRATRDDDIPGGTLLLLALNPPYSEEHGLVEAEPTARTSCDHPLLKDDNAKVHYCLDEDARSAQFVALIKPCQSKKSRRGAWSSLLRQHARMSRSKRSRSQMSLLMTPVRKGRSTPLCSSSLASTETPTLL